MPDPYADAASGAANRSSQLDQVLAALLQQAPDLEAAAVVSFDGLPMASALPPGMDEDRVAAMSAALLSLGERAAQGLGRGDLSQVYVEGDNGTVFLVSADDEAVLVAVGRRGAKVGLMLFEVKHAASAIATTLRVEENSAPPSLLAVAPEPDHFEGGQPAPLIPLPHGAHARPAAPHHVPQVAPPMTQPFAPAPVVPQHNEASEPAAESWQEYPADALSQSPTPEQGSWA